MLALKSQLITKPVFIIFLQAERLFLCLEVDLIRFLSADTPREQLFQDEDFASLAKNDFRSSIRDYSSFPLPLFSPFKNSMVSISF